jgi:histidinol dehydrogenase
VKRWLEIIAPEQLPSRLAARTSQDVLPAVREIVADVRAHGERALWAHGERLGDIAPGGPLVLGPDAFADAFARLESRDQAVLRRTAGRIEAFALAQKRCLTGLVTEVPGGRAGHDLAPVECAGCYVPGGRFPLPSSLLMTVLPARVAGVETVWAASPRPAEITLAAAFVAGVDGLLTVGGAQAIAALAYGTALNPSCDIVVGPGNQYVTAAKRLVFGDVAVDMTAGPSELTIYADHSAEPLTVAVDLLAQAEHDPLACPVLVTPCPELVEAVNREIDNLIATMSTAETMTAALSKGFAVVVRNIDEGVRVCELLAPEHLELLTAEAPEIAARFGHYGALFIGANAAEVLGDYGAGPNHTLPTGGAARYRGGLSVFDFLRVRTWLEISEPAAAGTLYEDAERLAELEGLAGHARSARLRRR